MGPACGLRPFGGMAINDLQHKLIVIQIEQRSPQACCVKAQPNAFGFQHWILYDTILYYAILCYTMLYYAVLFCTTTNHQCRPPRDRSCHDLHAAVAPRLVQRPEPQSRCKDQSNFYLFIYMHIHCIYIYIYIRLQIYTYTNVYVYTDINVYLP